MKPSIALKNKEVAVRSLVESYGLNSVRVFGSTAKHTDKEGSDLDIFVRINESQRGKFSLFDLFDLQEDLENLLGVKVDINIDDNKVPSHIRKDIEENSFSL